MDYLEEKLDVTIRHLESEGMEALSKRKKMMPNRVMRFCTENLKIVPAKKFYKEFQDKGIDFINMVGVRRDESKARENEEVFKISDGIKTLQPIAYWNTQRVFDYHKENGIEVNPLYKKGAKRVGCYPCIYATKHELQGMEQKYIDRLRGLENDISKIVDNPKNATFFPPDKDKFLKPTLDMGEDFKNQCVNQYGICE